MESVQESHSATTKPEEEHIRTLLVDTICLLCRNGLKFDNELKVQAVIGITLDQEQCFLVHINKCFERTYDDNCENESVQQTLEPQSPQTAPVTAEVPPTLGSVLNVSGDSGLKIEPPSVTQVLPTSGSKLSTDQPQLQQQQGSAKSLAGDEHPSKSNMQTAEPRSSTPAGPAVGPVQPVDECEGLDISKIRGQQMRQNAPYFDSDDCDGSSVVTTDSWMCPPRRDVCYQQYYKPSQPARQKPRYSFDAYRPKTKKRDRDPCEGLFDAFDDYGDDGFAAGQQYMYIDSGQRPSAQPKAFSGAQYTPNGFHNGRQHVRMLPYC